MKKILISILIILLIILAYFGLAKGMNFLGIKSISSIKEASSKLENDFNSANELSNKTYPTEVEGLDEAIKKLKISKQEYENKSAHKNGDDLIGDIEVKTYKIHYLWTILGNYRKDRGVQSLNLDLKSTQTEDVYDLEFTLLGSYTSITDFLYDIENDEELNFEIKNFSISSEIPTTNNEKKNEANSENNNTEENNNTTETEQNNNTSETEQNNTSDSSKEEKKTKNDGITLQAKFTVENIGITLD